MIKKITVCVLSLVLVLGFIPVLSIALNKRETKEYYKENSQIYVDEDGNKHTIYWTQGVEAPKMTTDKDFIGKDGYFDRIEDSEYLYYEAPITSGKGYYDLNKNPDIPYEKNLCYLASAANMLHWWIEQNSEYIDLYLKQLEMGNIYGQHEGLKDITTVDKQLWGSIRKRPTADWYTDYCIAQQLNTSEFVQKILNVYFTLDNGYFPDRPIDFFLNGFIPIDGEYPPVNNKNEFKPDQRGGFFYPIFGKEPLSNRLFDEQIYKKYDFYNENLKKMLNEGKAITISYYIGTSAHAINLWGAEYDENGRLCKIYVTDSNDIINLTKDGKTARGLHSMDFLNGENGVAKLNARKSHEGGSYVQGIVTLDLAKEKFDERVYDITSPQIPKFTKNIADLEVVKGKEIELTVFSEVKDSGSLYYQWFETASREAEGVPISEAKQNKLKVKIDSLTDRYFYCVVTNEKNGKSELQKSKVAKITPLDIPLINAETPTVSFDYQTKTYTRYVTPFPIVVGASVKDGGNLTYQWYRTSDSYAKGGVAIDGATSNRFIPPTNHPGNFYYYCVVTNTKNDVNGTPVSRISTPFSKRIIVKDSPLTNAQSPLLTTQPTDANYIQNQKAEQLSVSCEIFDGGTLSYKWYRAKDLYEVGELIEGENSSLFTPTTSEAGQFYYYCVITNTNDDATDLKVTNTESRRALISVEKVLSKDSTLKSLTIDEFDLIPNFSPNELEYSVMVPFNISSLHIKAIANDEKAKVLITGNENFVTGENIVKITVTAEDKSKSEYVLNVHKGEKLVSSESRLEDLTVEGQTLTPLYTDTVLNYCVKLPFGTNKINVIATAKDSSATVEILGNDNLSVGLNKVTVKVTAEDGSETVYTIDVTVEEKSEPIVPETPDTPETPETPDTPETPETPDNQGNTEGENSNTEPDDTENGKLSDVSLVLIAVPLALIILLVIGAIILVIVKKRP